MVEPIVGDDFAAPDEPWESIPRGVSLWDLAQEGVGSPRHTPIASGVDSAPSRRLLLRMAGILGAVGLVLALGLLAAPKAPVPQGRGSRGGGQPSPETAAPAISPAVPSGSGCSVQPLDRHPPMGSSDQIMVSDVPQHAVVTVDLAFAGGSAQYSGTSDSNGAADIRIAVMGTPLRPVEASVTAGVRSCQTSFTPSAPVSARPGTP